MVRSDTRRLSWYAGVLGEIRDLDVLRTGIVNSLWLIEDEPVQPQVLKRLDQRIEEAASVAPWSERPSATRSSSTILPPLAHQLSSTPRPRDRRPKCSNHN